jgi:BirA family biotin operon repressor/biotin-[acetyl-CoA-carboxylase] ligase
VLIEAVWEPKPLYIVGVGINVHHRVDDFPPEVAPNASSIELCSGETVTRVGILAAYLTELERLVSLAKAEQHRIWRAESLTIGRELEVSGQNAVYVGSATDIDADGRLLVASGGVVHELTGGDSTVRLQAV